MAVLLPTQDKPFPATMKAKVSLVILVAAVLVLLVAHLFRPTPQTTPNNPPTNGVAESANPTPASQAGSESLTSTSTKSPPLPRQPQRQNAPDTQGNWAGEPLPPGSNLQERLEELVRSRGVPLNVLTQQALAQWSNAMSGAAQEMNRPIDFYGKAIDEKGEPLSGANVRFSCLAFPEKLLATNAVTDAQGMFALTGLTGAALNVRVSKEGFEELQGTNQNSFSYYSPTATAFYPDPNNPVIFHLRRKE